MRFVWDFCSNKFNENIIQRTDEDFRKKHMSKPFLSSKSRKKMSVKMVNSASEFGLMCSVPYIFVEPISFLINCDLICSYSYAHHVYFILLYDGHLVTVHLKLLALFRSRLHSLLVGYIQPTLKFRVWIVTVSIHKKIIESYSKSMKKVLNLLLNFYGTFGFFFVLVNIAFACWSLKLVLNASK